MLQYPENVCWVVSGEGDADLVLGRREKGAHDSLGELFVWTPVVQVDVADGVAVYPLPWLAYQLPSYLILPEAHHARAYCGFRPGLLQSVDFIVDSLLT